MKWTNKLEELFKRKRNTDNSDKSINNQTPSAIPVDFNLKVLVVTDGHGCLESSDIPEDNIDICLLLGDLSLRDIEIVKEKVLNVPIYGVLGNHDGFDLYESCGIENIHGKVIEINGIRIAGIQGSLKYKYSDMPLYTDEESVEIAKSMECADILISHDSPKHLHGDRDFAHSGLQGVTYYCEKHNVPLNIHGHHHIDSDNVLENGTRTIGCYVAKIITIAPNCIEVNI